MKFLLAIILLISINFKVNATTIREIVNEGPHFICENLSWFTKFPDKVRIDFKNQYMVMYDAEKTAETSLANRGGWHDFLLLNLHINQIPNFPRKLVTDYSGRCVKMDFNLENIYQETDCKLTTASVDWNVYLRNDKQFIIKDRHPNSKLIDESFSCIKFE